MNCQMKKLSYSERKAMYGRGFIFLWVLGILFFFAIPFVKTIIYSFNDITSGADGLILEFVSFEKYSKLFKQDAEFMPKMVSTFVQMLYTVPLIVAFSLFVAVILNRKFPCRTFFRAVFFLPVVVLSGSIMILFKSDVIATSFFSGNDTGAKLFDDITILKDFLASVGLSEKLMGILQNIVSMVIDVCWNCGVQYLLCLATLQGIPTSLYESSDVEGATKWEQFWKITYPLSRPTLFLCVIYTIVINSRDSSVLAYAKTQAFTKFDYGYSCSIAIVYLLALLIVVGLVSLLLKRWYQDA